MSLNNNACSACTNFDRIVRGDGTRAVRHGWCAATSVYPHKEQEGQIFPPGVRRAGPDQLAVPTIVTDDSVVTTCGNFRGKP